MADVLGFWVWGHWIQDLRVYDLGFRARGLEPSQEVKISCLGGFAAYGAGFGGRMCASCFIVVFCRSNGEVHARMH